MRVTQVRFAGYRNDIGANNTSQEYLRNNENFAYDDLDGANKILFPTLVNSTEFSAGNAIDGGIEYKYLDDTNVLKTEQIVVSGGNMYIDALGTSALVYSGLTVGAKCQFAVLNDKLYMVNGKDYPLIYWGSKGIAYQMGAPAVEDSGVIGDPNGTYTYAIGFVLAGGEEYLGTISNSITVSNKKITVNLPIGYTGTLTRNLYRTINGGATYKLVANIPNNTALTYTDSTADGSLGANIGIANNECPKPYFIQTSYEKLVGCVVDKFPTQIFIAESEIELFDAASFSDISNIGTDNTPCKAMNQQFSQVIVASEKNFYLVDVSGTTNTVQPTSVNIGCKDGYSMVNIPANESFPGGVMFLSTLNDIRVINGLTGLIAATINNVETQNWSQPIKGTLDGIVTTGINIYAYFYNYTYHIIIGSQTITFNTKTNGWATQRLVVNDHVISPKVLFEYNNLLYMGRSNESYIEKMYSAITYNGTEVPASIRTASLPTFPIQGEKGVSYSTSNDVKFFESIKILYYPSLNYKLGYKITINDDAYDTLEGEIELTGGAFNSMYYSPVFYSTGSTNEDYKIIRINRFGRWINVEFSQDIGIVYIRGYDLIYDQ